MPKVITQALHLNIAEAGLMANLLHVAMAQTGREFKDQPMEVKLLSTKIARAYERLEKRTRPKRVNVVDFGSFKMTTINEVVKGVNNELPNNTANSSRDEGNNTGSPERTDAANGQDATGVSS